VEADILASHATGQPLEDIGPVTDARGVSDMIEVAHTVHVAPALRRYVVELVDATRHHPDIYLGASPRASIMLLRASRALAAASERDYVIPDDVKGLVVPALAHRVIVSADAAMSGRPSSEVLGALLEQVDVPVAESP
jgi:MoxR-like ATPase